MSVLAAVAPGAGHGESLLKLSVLDWKVPSFSTVSRCQAKVQVQLSYHRRPVGLHLLVDGTGIKFLDEGKWKRKKHGLKYRRQWHKAHMGIDAQALDIWTIEATANTVGDRPILPHLLAQVPVDEPLASVMADGACDTRMFHEAIAARGTFAVVPPRKTARAWKPGSAAAVARNEAVAAYKRLGRRVWTTWSGYHRHSLVETKMYCFKR